VSLQTVDLERQRVEREIRRIGHLHGFVGDPLDESPPMDSDIEGEKVALALFIQLPWEIRRHPASVEMARGIVFGDRRRRARRATG